MIHNHRARTVYVWRWAWGMWGIGVGGSFVVLERMALHNRLHPTLSTTIRRTLGVYPQTRWGHVALIGFAAFWAWLVVHVGRVPDDVYYGIAPPAENWYQVGPKMWYRDPRRRALI